MRVLATGKSKPRHAGLQILAVTMAGKRSLRGHRVQANERTRAYTGQRYKSLVSWLKAHYHENRGFNMEKVNLSQKFSLLSDYWSPKIAGEINDSHVKLVKLKGE